MGHVIDLTVKPSKRRYDTPTIATISIHIGIRDAVMGGYLSSTQ